MEKVLKDERNYGIDLLRVVSMFFVVILHSLGQGGLLDNSVVDSPQYKFCWFVEICAYSAVNIFALISGYVSYRDKEKRVNYSNYLNIWLQVVFYGIVVTGIFNIINPKIISKSDYLITLFPVTNGLYWYLTAYTGLFVVMPFLNKGIRNCSNKTLKKLFIVIIIMFSFFDTITDKFILCGGYSFVWIVLLYVLGAIIKKCEIGKNCKKYKMFIAIIILYIITYLYKIYGFEFSIFKISITKNLLVSYLSPTVLGVAILYLIIFSKIKFKNINKKIVKFLAPSAFAIYILNNHRIIWEYVIKGMFTNLCTQSIMKIFVYVFAFSIIFVILSILIDKIRLLLFKIFNIKKLTQKMADLLNNIVDKCSSFL